MKKTNVLLLLILATSLCSAQGYYYARAAAGGAPTAVEDTVSADNHDAFSDPGDESLVYPTTTHVPLGWYDPGPAEIAFQWVSSVPQGSTLDSAHVELYGGTSDHGVVTASIFAYNVDDVPVFDGTHTHTMSAHATLTADSVVWTVPSTDFETVRTPNLISILQTVINRAGYAQGQRVGIVIRMYPEWSSGEYNLWWQHEDAVNTDRWARIEWDYH